MINQRDQEIQNKKKANEKSLAIIKDSLIGLVPSRINDYLIFSDIWQPMDLSGFVKITITGKTNRRDLDNVGIKRKFEIIPWHYADYEDIEEAFKRTTEECITEMVMALIKEIKKEEKRIEVNN